LYFRGFDGGVEVFKNGVESSMFAVDNGEMVSKF
jgi:hypothetical protein